jgi:hypothetical protein
MADWRIPNSEHCLHILEQTPGILRNLLSIATPEQLDWPPSPERWSIAMVLAHLADVETKGFHNRFVPMLAEDQPLLKSYDPGELFKLRTHFDPYAEMARFEEQRGKTLALLRGMPDGAGDRTGRHEEFGVITIGQLMNEFAFHDLGHTRQIMELYRSHVFYPEMGAYQGYYKINP